MKTVCPQYWCYGVVAFVAMILLSACGSSKVEILRETEQIIGVRFPRHSELEAELATEFSYVGRLRVRQSDAASFLRELKFSPDPELQFLTTWGKYKDLFNSSDRVRGFLGSTGVIPGKNSWEIVYDPKSEQMWFFLGFALSQPLIPKSENQ